MPGIDLLNRLYAAEKWADVEAAAQDLAQVCMSQGPQSNTFKNVVESLSKGSRNKKQKKIKESAVCGLRTLFQTLPRGWDVLLLQQTTLCLDLVAEPNPDIKSDVIKAVDALFTTLPIEALTTALLPILLEYITSTAPKYPSRVLALQLISEIVDRTPSQVAEILPEIIPAVTNAMRDVKKEVADEAIKTMTKVCTVLGNRDIEPHIPALIDTMAHPDNVHAVIKTLGHVTFVQEVNGPVLAVMIPLLERALKERRNETVRMTFIVLTNLCDLVVDPKEAVKFLPALFPHLEKAMMIVSSPEAKEKGVIARDTMLKAQKGVNVATENGEQGFTHEDVEKVMNDVIEAQGETLERDAVWKRTGQFVARNLLNLIKERRFKKDTWINLYIIPYLSLFISRSTAHTVAETLYNHFDELDRAAHGANDFDENEKPFVDVDPLHVAYGAKMILNRTVLRLYRGRRYAILGRNGAGKSTLLRKIAMAEVDGFPTKEVRTFFLEYKNRDDVEANKTILESLVTDPSLSIVKEDAEKLLETMGLDSARRGQQVGSLSGGWNMKLELARAMLMKADVLLLDEPTNHLDVTTVAWLTNYLLEHNEITVMAISHDSKFLDHIATDIIHFERDCTLSYHKGNLSEFVKKRPEAATYYALSDTNVKFRFPKPEGLVGLGQSQTRVILRMRDVEFTYKGASKPQLANVSVALTMRSRVAIVGPNGAGKSTLVKVLREELKPQKGKVLKHPNLRIGYVAQHAFETIDEHLDETPIQYIRARYANGNDSEASKLLAREVSDEEQLAMDAVKFPTGGNERQRKANTYGTFEKIVGRVQESRKYKYQIKFKDMDSSFNNWIDRDVLVRQGFEKKVLDFDDWEALRDGLRGRETSTKALRQHLEDVGLDGEIAQFTQIRSLSGGQKVKVVIAGMQLFTTANFSRDVESPSLPNSR
jgi:elongation factor 3